VRSDTVGPYRILEKIGEGGMGEVYRAHDERLNRHVAIKFLPPAFATDPERLARFSREARTLAALNHSNIAGVHGLEEGNGTAALVMEFVEGEDLAARLARGPIPLDDALRLARQIADGLDAAHQQGIIHRDLKPANIKVRPDGTVKLLDFGLAKVLEPTSTAPAALEPTVTSADLTRAGAVMGTAAYMSPEQARGRPVDARTDVWAFGCVLYEMLTGARAFAGSHPAEVTAAVLTHEPDLGALPPGTPRAVRRLLRRCLRKDPSERLRDMGDARLELVDASDEDRDDLARREPSTRSRWRERLAWAAAMVALLVALGILLARPAPDSGELRLEMSTPPGPSPSSVAVSPNGSTVVFVASSNDQAVLWVRGLHETAGRPLPGTEGGDSPFWSPDSRSVAFFADGRLKRIDLDGGSVQVLANAATGTDGTWGREGVIVFASRGLPLSKVSAEGGDAESVGGVVAGSNFSPYFLPDGRHFLYYHRAAPETRGVYVGDLQGPGLPRRVLDADSGAAYARSGHLLYSLHQTLYGQAFDAGTLRVSGDPFPVAGSVAAAPGYFGSGVSVSDTGTIAYRARSIQPQRRLAWFDRTGQELGPLGAPGETFSAPSLSPDGRRLVFYRGNAEGNVDIWTMDAERGTQVRETTEPGDDVMPVWSPDGRQIAFSSSRAGPLQVYRRTPDDGGEELLYGDFPFAYPTDWSSDGRYLLITAEGARRSLDIWALPMQGDRKPFPVLQSAQFAEQSGQFSPDGRWLAYLSNESGRNEIYLRPFPGPGTRVVVSVEGGSQARWRRDGKELFYVARSGDLMAVPVRLPEADGVPEVGTPARLFTPPLGSAMQLGDARHQYVVSADGRRFLVATLTPSPPAPISLILNWKPRP